MQAARSYAHQILTILRSSDIISILPSTLTPSHTLPHLTTLTIVWWAQAGTCSYGQLVRYLLCIVAVATAGAQCRHPGHPLQSPAHSSTDKHFTNSSSECTAASEKLSFVRICFLIQDLLCTMNTMPTRNLGWELSYRSSKIKLSVKIYFLLQWFSNQTSIQKT